MSEKTSIFRQFPGAFWTANVMEIFERMGWYGFFAVSTLYLTNPVDQGGLGFSSEDRGVIQGLTTFFLYLFPAVFGALADRYGYKAMFLASSVVMVPAYLLLQIPTTFWAFFAVYFLVAVGHGMFKPVVISTVAKSTTEKTGSMGFGIFYMMVNVGGFLGPIVAGVIRGWSWNYVFLASSAWIVLMALTCFLFYREPARDVAKEKDRSLKEVFSGMIEVVGSGRFFLLIAGLLTILVMGSKWWDFGSVAAAAGIWVAVNLLLDGALRVGGPRGGGPRGGGPRSPEESRGGRPRPWFLRPMAIGEGRYLVFLLLMAGFWTSFNQIFMTLPEYIRDYVDTRDLVAFFAPVARGIAGLFEGIGIDTSAWGKGILENGQVKPEHLINLNAFGIIVGQVFISYLVRNMRPLGSMILGVAVTVGSFLLYLLGASGWVIVGAVLVFSVGEMLASPRSKEYAGRIAPPDKVGMYMGYFYWCVALGNLFGGLLSGVCYQHFGPADRGGIDRPGIMWALFAGIALTTAVALMIYDRWVRRNPSAA